MNNRPRQSRRVGFVLTLIWTIQEPMRWQATLKDQQEHIRHFETPLALLEWLEQFVLTPLDGPTDLP